MAVPVEQKKVFIEISEYEKVLGRIEINLRFDVCPITCDNFLYFINHKVKGEGYIGSPIHRIIPDFMMQGGDFTNGDGTGGRGKNNKEFPDENFILKHTGIGDVSMANAGPNTNGSQFFITFGKCSWLDGRHVVFGKVVSDLGLLKKIESYGTLSGKTSSKLHISDCGEVEN